VFALLWMVILFALGINQALISKPMLSLAPKMELSAKEQYLQNILWLQAGLSTLLFLVGILVWWGIGLLKLSIPHSEFGPLLSGILFFQLFHDYFRKRCFIQDRLFLVFSMDAILYLGQLILISFFWYQGQLSLNLVLLSILAVNIAGVTLIGFGLKLRMSIHSDFLESWKKQFHYSKWLVGTAVLSWFSGNYFIIIGAAVLGPIAVGALRMAQNIMGFFHILFLSMENIVPIEAANQLQNNGWFTMSQYLKSMTIKIGAFFLILLVIVASFSPWIIELIYGSEYLDYSYIIVAYCGLYILVYLSLPLQFALRSIELTYPLFVAYIITTIFSFLSAHFFLAQWGMEGLLAGLIITQFITVLTFAFYCWRYNQRQYSSKESENNKILI